MRHVSIVIGLLVQAHTWLSLVEMTDACTQRASAVPRPRFLDAASAPAVRLPGVFSYYQAVMHAARFGKSAASLGPGPQRRPFCFIQPCRSSHLPAGLAQCLESTEIARRHLQTVSEPAASAWSGSESVQKRKPAELSKGHTYMVLYTVSALQAVRSNPPVGATRWANLKLDGPSQLIAVPGPSWIRLLEIISFLSQALLSPAQRCGYPFAGSPFPFHGLFSHFPANQNSETFVNQIILTISG